MYVAVARRRGIPEEKLSGTVQNDILKEYVARGTHIFPIAPSMRLVTDLLGHCAARMPKFNPISISGYHIREAGSTAAQELAFTFGDGLAYVEAAREAGIDLARLLPRLSFFFNVHNNFLEEIAKFRAARRLWSRLVSERFGVEEAACRKVRFHAQTAGCTLTAQEPGNNVTRVALQALAAVLGGCQSLHTNSRDEALGLPTEESARIALRTQQLIGYESGVTSTVDPLAGSYCIESLTCGLEREALELLAEVDRLGGMKAAIEAGWVQRQIQESAWRQQQDLEAGRAVVVGVNRFVSSEGSTIPALRLDPELERRQHARLAALRRARDGAATARALAVVEREAAGRGNLFEPILEAVERQATLGELVSALKRVYGQHVELRDF
jgi:methylmalonyl-CoA mutase N-terminal domain/subunit